MTDKFADEVEENLSNWRKRLFHKIPVGGLLARSPIAHKWKAPFRNMMLRETAFWHLHDLMEQSYRLHREGHSLGARMLLRSGFETLATLKYVNLLTEQVLAGKLDFHVFGQKTKNLLLGSRHNEAMPKSTNVMTVLEKCEKRYPGTKELYASLSESAHSSYEGLCAGYSTIDHDEFETVFSYRRMELHGDRHLDAMTLCMGTFHHEYDEVWPELFERFETWIEANNEKLEATKAGAAV